MLRHFIETETENVRRARVSKAHCTPYDLLPSRHVSLKVNRDKSCTLWLKQVCQRGTLIASLCRTEVWMVMLR